MDKHKNDIPSQQEILSWIHTWLDEPSDTSDVVLKLKQVDNNIMHNIANSLINSQIPNDRLNAVSILMRLYDEKYVDLVIPLLNDIDTQVRWFSLSRITRTNKFLNDENIIKLVIKSLLEDLSPEVRVEAAESLGYCKTTPEVLSALEYARDHDFEVDENGYTASYIAKAALKRIKEGY